MYLLLFLLLFVCSYIPVGHDAEGGPDQGKQGRVEVDRSVAVQPHVHRD